MVYTSWRDGGEYEFAERSVRSAGLNAGSRTIIEYLLAGAV